MKIKRMIPWLIGMSMLAACAPQAEIIETTEVLAVIEVIETSAAPTPIPPTATVLPVLSEAQLKQATYYVPVYQRQVTLVDGHYEAPGELTVNLLPWMAFGDLNSDGLQDAAVLLAENGGGTGTYVSLVTVINQNGQPMQAGTTLIDDRPIISGIEIFSGKIIVSGTIHSLSDPFCCPTLPVQQHYTLDGDTLVLLRQTSSTPGGLVREINITNPLMGSESGSVVQVTGDMPIAPFENNLLYRVYDLGFNPLDAGPFMVNANEPGGPAQFNNALSSPAFIPGSVIWLELSELSAADGTPLVIERIKLTIR